MLAGSPPTDASPAQLRDALAARDALIVALASLFARLFPHERLQDHGLPLGYFTPMETVALRLLLPPGRVVDPAALTQLVFGHLAWDGMDARQRRHLGHNVQTVLGRLRRKLRPLGWQLPGKSHDGWLVLGPRQDLPAWYAPIYADGRPCRGPRRVTPERARAAVRRFAAGQRIGVVQRALQMGDEALHQLRDGTHWTQREGRCPRIDQVTEDPHGPD